MSQPTVFYTSPTLFRKSNNRNDRPTKVREAIRKYDMLAKSNSIPSTNHASPVVEMKENNHETMDSSSSSSTDSSTSESGTDEQVSTMRTEMQTPTIEVQRLVLAKTSESIQDEEATYDNELENNHRPQRKFSDVNLDDNNETDAISSSYSKLVPNRHHPSRLRTDSYRHGIENPTSSPIVENRMKTSDADSTALEIDQSTLQHRPNNDQRLSSFSTNYETTGTPLQSRPTSFVPRSMHPPVLPSPRLLFNKPYPQDSQDDSEEYKGKRTLPISNFLLELGALAVVFIICMILVSAIREDETKLRTTMQIAYSYIYLVSSIWMIWCIFDIIDFRRKWQELTASARDSGDYTDITQRYSDRMFYFPDIHNTGGLFMRIGAGLLCMGGLILTVLEIAKTIVKINADEVQTRAGSSSTAHDTPAVTTTKLITYVLRFIFHCVQYSFLFRYSNLVINHHHLLAKVGLIHIVIANFCTWFEAIVIETLEQMHNSPNPSSTSNAPYATTPSSPTSNETNYANNGLYFFKVLSASNSGGSSSTNRTAMEVILEIESTIAVYLYPCLIEYSLISVTVFFIMWRNVGKDSNGSFLHFGDRHNFSVNCSRASRGLLIGGIIILLTVVSLIPSYLFDEQAISISQITGLVLLVVSLSTVALSYISTTKLFYDDHAHVDIFDQALILITTVGDFAYSIFRLFASIFSTESESGLPFGFEITIVILAILQTFLQSAFIMDALKRRTRTKQENRNKPGREMITALLLMNLAIWLHDSLSAKKVRLNPAQVAYYNVGTWAIIQAFTSPLSIFYRFHSSVCLADIWQEVYHDHGSTGGTHAMIPLVHINGGSGGDGQDSF